MLIYVNYKFFYFVDIQNIEKNVHEIREFSDKTELEILKNTFHYPNLDIKKKKRMYPSAAGVEDMIDFLSAKEKKKQKKEQEQLARKQEKDRIKSIKEKELQRTKTFIAEKKKSTNVK